MEDKKQHTFSIRFGSKIHRTMVFIYDQALYQQQQSCFFSVADLSHMIHIIDTDHPWDVYSINSGHNEIISCLEWDQSGQSS